MAIFNCYVKLPEGKAHHPPNFHVDGKQRKSPTPPGHRSVVKINPASGRLLKRLKELKVRVYPGVIKLGKGCKCQMPGSTKSSDSPVLFLSLFLFLYLFLYLSLSLFL